MAWMKVQGQHYRTIWPNESNNRIIRLIDQRFLPHQFVIEEVGTPDEMAVAIQEMHARRAGVSGAAGAGDRHRAARRAAPGAALQDDRDEPATRLNGARPRGGEP